MSSWRDPILKQFKRGIARLTLVSDPDDLLTEETMTRSIRDRGFEIVPFDDSIAFRYAYESKYRSVWDEGKDTDLVVVLRTGHDLNNLPYDLLKAGRHLTFALHLLFPKLSYPVIRSLDRSRLDELYDAYQQHDGSRRPESFCFLPLPASQVRMRVWPEHNRMGCAGRGRATYSVLSAVNTNTPRYGGTMSTVTWPMPNFPFGFNLRRSSATCHACSEEANNTT